VSVIKFGLYTYATAADKHFGTRYLPAILQLRVDDSERHFRLKLATS
jgi:hypothetical protein